MAHTPGPWTIHLWGDNEYDINAASETVCNVPGFDDDTVDADRAGANARLIAAAPELLAALKAHLPWAEEPVQGWGAWADAVAAIAKAEGRT